MTNTDKPTDAERAEQVATDLERLAAFLRANPDIAGQLVHQRILVSVSSADDVRSTMADVTRRARRAGATTTKETADKYASVLLSFGLITLDVFARREQVCERVVVGRREVEVNEPDPAEVEKAIAALPKVKRTDIVEDVEWRCTPLLAPEDDERCKCGFRAPELGPHPLCPVHSEPEAVTA